MDAPGKTGGRLAYADGLRVLAAFAVIVLHVSVGWLWKAPDGSADQAVLLTYDALVRWCVPLFVLLSGMFLLDPAKPLPRRKLAGHILRVLVSLLAWGSFYAVITYGRPDGRFTASGVLEALLHVARADTHYHLWFLYMILGLYLVTPVLRAFLRGAEEGDVTWFLLLFLVFGSVLPLLAYYLPGLSIPKWLELLGVPAGYMGCYLAGWYLRSRRLSPAAEGWVYALGGAGLAFTVWQGGAVFGYLTPNVLFATAAVFLLFRRLLGGMGPHKLLDVLSDRSFGIYLVHPFFILVLDHFGLTTLVFPPPVSVPVLSLLVFAASFALSWALGKVPVVGRYLT